MPLKRECSLNLFTNVSTVKVYFNCVLFEPEMIAIYIPNIHKLKTKQKQAELLIKFIIIQNNSDET